MSAAAEEHPADGITLGQLRAELRELAMLADTSEKPMPDRELPSTHPMGPAREWMVTFRATLAFEHNRLWSVLARDADDFANCIYIHTPDSFDGDYVATHTTEARQLAMAILAACDRADELTAGVTHLGDRRKRRPTKGDQVT
jgi:hypothetical protein